VKEYRAKTFFGQIEELITINEEILRIVYSEPDLVCKKSEILVFQQALSFSTRRRFYAAKSI